MMDNNSVDNSQSVLSVLPELVWRCILDKMDDSRVTENVLHAFPELSALFHKMKPVWFFDQILPHLSKNGDREGKKMLIRSCQNVCKRWTCVTHSFVQNHPSQLPYNHQGITRRSVPYREFSYNEGIYNHGLSFYSTQKLLRFHDAMKNHPRDPFQGGWVTLAIIHPQPQIDEFLDVALVFLQTFGKYIKIFSLNLRRVVQDVSSSRRILSKILSCLSYLENAHYLYINFNLNLDELTDADLVGVLPRGLHFETIRIDNEISPNVKRILLNWLVTVEKLIVVNEFPMECLNLLNIVELEMILFRDTFTANLNATIPCFPQLKKLSIVFLDFRSPSVDVASLFELLASLQLEELILQGVPLIPLRDREYSSTGIPQFPSLKYLEIADQPEQTLNFLKAFPSLEHLSIDSSRALSGIGNEERVRTSRHRLTWKQPSTLTSTIQCYLYEPVVPSTVSIWNEIPSLKLLTTTMFGTVNYKIQFAKECGNKPFYSYLFHR